jgi:hypothetical protein
MTLKNNELHNLIPLESNSDDKFMSGSFTDNKWKFINQTKIKFEFPFRSNKSINSLRIYKHTIKSNFYLGSVISTNNRLIQNYID